MDFSRYIDQYCERVAPGLLAEPINLITNLAFFLAAFFALLKLNSLPLHGAKRRAWLALIILTFLVGTGSALFHSVATAWAQMADVIPIIFLLFAFIFVHCYFGLGIGLGKSVLALITFLFVTVLISLAVDSEKVNGSQDYFGTVVMLIVMGLDMWRRNVKSSAKMFIAGGICFAISLVFRSVDMKFCNSWPLGTHFIWHSLNGLLIYFMLVAGMSYSAKAPN